MSVTEGQPPAAAYALVASAFHPSYFLRPPPVRGTQLTVTGTDGVATVWQMTGPTAAALRPWIEAHPYLTLTAEQFYSPTAPASGDTQP